MATITVESIHENPDAAFVAVFADSPIVYNERRYDRLQSVLQFERLARRGKTQPEDDDPHERVVRHVEGLLKANEALEVDEVFLSAYAISKQIVEAKGD